MGLLKKTDPALASLNKKDLISKKKGDELDGYTGATISAVKNEVVQGAVYSCFTLWHIANGCVKDSIQSHTKTFLSPTLVNRIMMSDSPEASYFLISNFEKDDFFTYKTEMLEMLRNSEGYFAKEALDVIPTELIAEKGFQDSLADLYPKLDFFAQKSLLERLENSLTSDKLALILAANLDRRNTSQKSLT